MVIFAQRALASVNARPLRDALTQQAETRHHGHQQQNQKQWPERFTLNRIHAPFQKGIDIGLVGLGELLRFGTVGLGAV